MSSSSTLQVHCMRREGRERRRGRKREEGAEKGRERGGNEKEDQLAMQHN